jgi:hypothetical protein
LIQGPNIKLCHELKYNHPREQGCLNLIKQTKYGDINFCENIENETLLHYAIKYGDTTFLKHAFKLGARIDTTNKLGNTLLEYACLLQDPNMINFLTAYGADMKKHLEFRDGKKYFNNSQQIDIALIEKKIMESSEDTDWEIKYLDFIFDYIKSDNYIDIDYCNTINSTISIEKITVKKLIKKLDLMIHKWPLDSKNTFINILKEELVNQLAFKLGCPSKPLEIILYNLVPFIELGYKLKLNWLLSLEVKFLILKILKNKICINTKELKNELIELLYLSYIKPEIMPEGLIQTIVLQWIYKIKV